MTPDDQQRPSADRTADDEELAQSLDLDEHLDDNLDGADGAAPGELPPAPGAAPVSLTKDGRPDAAPSEPAAAPSAPADPADPADPAAAPSEPGAAASGTVPSAAGGTVPPGRRGRHTRGKGGDGTADADEKKRRKAPWWELPVLIALAIGIAIVVKSFVVQPFFIPSGSMEKTLHGCQGCAGDRILVNKPVYDFRDPHPGDIVVFNKPSAWPTSLSESPPKPPGNPVLRWGWDFGQPIGFVPPSGEVLVKRVIAIGGQTVQGQAVDGGTSERITVTDADGKSHVLTEPYVYIDPGQVDNSATFGPVTVPKGRLWVMGDHRNDSADSRYHCRPNEEQAPQLQLSHCNAVSSTVPVSDVIGKAVVIAWPPSRWRTLGTPTTFKSLADGATPGLAGAALVLPVFLVRRRRRRTP